MNEEIIQHIFQFRIFNHNELKTIEGESLEIISVGTLNRDAGPDFSQSLIKISNTKLAGNIEVHINSSDWFKHHHNTDLAYSNVVLHVVYNFDKEVLINGSVLPTLELKNLISTEVLQRYFQLGIKRNFIPCESSLQNVPTLIKNSVVDRMIVERIEEKSKDISSLLLQNNNNWEETFYYTIASAFGFGINKFPFLKTVKSLPMQILAKHKSNAFQIEALVMGCSGFLNSNYHDEYLKKLQNEFQFLAKKYQIVQVTTISEWKFSKLHPSNFPSIRLSQFASLINHSNHLFSKVCEAKNVSELRQLFSVEASEYWQTHFQFDKLSPYSIKRLGEKSIDLILINAVVPVLFSYSKLKSQFRELVFQILLDIKPENNSIIKQFNNFGFTAKDAYSSQALLQLYKYHCTFKKCLQCGIGMKILKN